MVFVFASVNSRVFAKINFALALFASGALSGLLPNESGWGANPADRGGPNVLFISIDDLNDWVGCMGGHPQALTPNLDRLAKSGVLFTNAHCVAPACNPSRTAVFTGVAPNVSGLYRNEQSMRDILPNATLLPDFLRSHGYRAKGSGKLLHYFIDARSWDEYFPKKHTENPFAPHLDWGKRPKSLPRGGPWQYVETDWHAFDVSDEEFGGDVLTADFIAGELAKEHEQPFFLGCGIYRPHEPWFNPKHYFDLFPIETIQLPIGYRPDDLDDLPSAGVRMGRNRYFDHIRKHGQWRAAIRGYLASIAFADANLGRVLKALDEGPNRDNTIVILWSDHGWHLGEKQHWQKFTGWRVCTRVPLMIRVPKGVPGLPEGTQAGAVCDQPVDLLGLFRTVTGLCGIEAPNQAGGHSLISLLRDVDAEWPHAAKTYLGSPGAVAISGNAERYIRYSGGGEEFYDIHSDPFEWRNLAKDDRYAAQLDEYRELVPASFAELANPLRNQTNSRVMSQLTDLLEDFSQPIGNRFSCRFINRGDEDVELFWIDPVGKSHSYGLIQAGSYREQSTRKGAVWVVQTLMSNEKRFVIVDSGDRSFVIPK